MSCFDDEVIKFTSLFFFFFPLTAATTVQVLQSRTKVLRRVKNSPDTDHARDLP